MDKSEKWEAINRMRRIRKASRILLEVCEGRAAISYPPSAAFLAQISKTIYEETTYLQTLIGH